MLKIEKQDVIDAFKNRKGKRNFLLYIYYQNYFSHEKLPADLIAKKISQDLGIEIKRGVIYHIFRRYLKYVKNISTEPLNIKYDNVRKDEEKSKKKAMLGKKIEDEEPEEEKPKWTNADDIPYKNPYDDIFKGL